MVGGDLEMPVHSTEIFMTKAKNSSCYLKMIFLQVQIMLLLWCSKLYNTTVILGMLYLYNDMNESLYLWYTNVYYSTQPIFFKLLLYYKITRDQEYFKCQIVNVIDKVIL